MQDDLRFWTKALFLIVLWLSLLVVFNGDTEASVSKAELVAHAERMEQKYDLQPGLLRAICEQETRWRNVSGAHGEIGVCQVQAATVRMICPSCAGNVHGTVFQIGSRGYEVLAIQTELRDRGLYAGRLDSVFGPITKRAVALYQHKTGLSVDGVVGKKTWTALVGTTYPGRTIAEALWNPKENIEWAARFLVWLTDNVSGEPIILMAAYNGGPANQSVRYMVGVSQRLLGILVQPEDRDSTNRRGEM